MTVSAADDDDGVPDAAVTLRHTVRGGDYGPSVRSGQRQGDDHGE